MLRDGALPLRKALGLATQAARGLAAAHARGITHRDLKPENIFLATSGSLKILDFGLARLQGADGAPPEETTESQPTGAGALLGTVSYMSPEQAKGLAVDARSDVFSFGVVLYEMLSGRHPFRRASAAETVSAILRDETPGFGPGQGRLPGAVERLVRRSLEKRPEDRFQTAGDLAVALEQLAQAEEDAPRSSFPRWLWGACAVAALAAGTVAYRRGVEPPPRAVSPVRFTIEIEESGVRTGELSASGGRGYPGLVAVCPDGTCVAYRAEEQGVARLHLRRFDRPEPEALPGTENGYAPFFSPDGRWMGFFAGSHLKAVSVRGRKVRTVCEAREGWSGSFAPEGTIFFSPRLGPVFRVSSEGGLPEGVTRLASGETSHRWASLLPDGRTASLAWAPWSSESSKLECDVLLDQSPYRDSAPNSSAPRRPHPLD